jgi:hypothetical protein
MDKWNKVYGTYLSKILPGKFTRMKMNSEYSKLLSGVEKHFFLKTLIYIWQPNISIVGLYTTVWKHMIVSTRVLIFLVHSF